MWDLAAYRVLDKPHHRTGPTWKIYPSYDFTRKCCRQGRMSLLAYLGHRLPVR